MKKTVFSLLVVSFILASCSTGKKALERGDYFEAINKAVERLQNDPDNRNASNVLKEGYPMAVTYYQEEIDLALSGTDRFKWGKTVDVMEQMNLLAEFIRKVPAARKLVNNPKTYTSEMRPARERAAEELYQAGQEQMELNTKEAAQQAYRYFVRADQMIPAYKDLNTLIVKSKQLATFIVIVEQIPVYSETYALSADFFYDRLLANLIHYFPEKSFVNFYSDSDAANLKIEHPDMILKMRFSDFFISPIQHAETEEPLQKRVEEQVKVSQRDTVVYRTRVHDYRGTIKIISDQVIAQGVLRTDVVDFQGGDRLLLTERLPGQFVWNNAYGVFVGDKEVLDAKDIALLNNSAYPPPAPQALFVEMSKPVFNQLSSRLRSFFLKYAN